MKTLIFDFDGTLVDSMQLYLHSFNQVAADFALPKINELRLRQVKQAPLSALLKQYQIGPLKLAKIIDQLNRNLRREIASVKFFPELRSLLLNLAKKYQLGLLSSNRLENIEDFLEKQNFTNVFDFVYASKNLFGKDKVLSGLIKKHQLDKKEVLYFGDEVRDIEACQKIGVKIAAVTWGFNDKKLLALKQPDYLLASPQDIADLLL